MRIGMRNIKTALSVFLCVTIFQIFNMGSPFYAAIAAIISMQSSVSDSFITGKNRMLGTFLGAFVGLSFALMGPSNPFLIGIGIIIIISISNWLGWNKSISIAGVVFIAIMVNLNGKSPWSYSLYRIVDTLVGISISVLINYFISPPINVSKISEHSQVLLSLILDNLKIKLCNGQSINIQELNNRLLSLQEDFSDYKKEFKGKKSTLIDNSNAGRVIDILKNIMDHLKVINEIETNLPLNKENCIRVNKLFDCHMIPLMAINDNTAVVYNYHMEKVLNLMALIDT